MSILFKLVDENWKTRAGYENETSWEIGKTNRAEEPKNNAPLCTNAWLHAYENPWMAFLMNPIHAEIQNPRWLMVTGEVGARDSILKCGCVELTPIKEIQPPPPPSVEKLVEFAIKAALLVYSEKTFVQWAENWLSGEDKSEQAAWAAKAAAWAAAEAAKAAAWAEAAANAAARAAAKAAAWAAAEAAETTAWAAAEAAEAAVDNNPTATSLLSLLTETFGTFPIVEVNQ